MAEIKKFSDNGFSLKTERVCPLWIYSLVDIK